MIWNTCLSMSLAVGATCSIIMLGNWSYCVENIVQLHSRWQKTKKIKIKSARRNLVHSIHLINLLHIPTQQYISLIPHIYVHSLHLINPPHIRTQPTSHLSLTYSYAAYISLITHIYHFSLHLINPPHIHRMQIWRTTRSAPGTSRMQARLVRLWCFASTMLPQKSLA